MVAVALFTSILTSFTPSTFFRAELTLPALRHVSQPGTLNKTVLSAAIRDVAVKMINTEMTAVTVDFVRVRIGLSLPIPFPG